jgi:carboxyl-terminal processing protease
VIVDLRYNGGGRVDIANLLGDLLAGLIAEGKVFYALRFNERLRELDTVQPLGALPRSLITARVVFITTGASASASELMINGLDPHLDVAVVGERTYGKPVGQSGVPMTECGLLLRPVTFETVNALEVGGCFDGLPVSAGCGVGDDVEHDLGDPHEAMLTAALHWLDSGSLDCGIDDPSAPVAMHLRAAEAVDTSPPEVLAQLSYGLY